jgi:hypothetical protein
MSATGTRYRYVSNKSIDIDVQNQYILLTSPDSFCMPVKCTGQGFKELSDSFSDNQAGIENKQFLMKNSKWDVPPNIWNKASPY